MIDSVGVIYSLATKARKELIIPTFGYDELEVHKARVQPDEGWLDVPMSIYCRCNNFNEVDAYIASVLGAP